MEIYRVPINGPQPWKLGGCSWPNEFAKSDSCTRSHGFCPHLQAAEEGLTEVYNSPMLSQLQDWALSPHKATGGRTVGIYMGGLGYGYNKELLASKGLPTPKCWKDLLNPAFKNEVQFANPKTSWSTKES